MTFRLADPEATYRTAVHVDVPSDDGPQTQECAVWFRLLPPGEGRALAAAGDAAFLAAVVADWEGVLEHDGAAIDCTPESISRLAEVAYFARAVGAAYFAFAAGLPGKT